MKKILLSLSLITVAIAGNAQNCTELFISEYVEGSGNNKAIEVYNPTQNAINLSNYRIIRFSNGSSFSNPIDDIDSTDLVGSIASYSVHVLVNGQTTTVGSSPACSPVLQGLANQLDHAYGAPTYMNGDDAIALVRINPYKMIDIFGVIGEKPNTAWSDVAPYIGTVGKWWTKDHSMQRKASIKQGVATNPSQFNVKLEWDSLPKDDWSKLNNHDCDCKSVGINENEKAFSLTIFPNPSNGSELAFVSNTAITQIALFNNIGELVYSQTPSKSENTIIISNVKIAKGIYYAVVKNNVGTKTEKIVIQ